MIIGNIDNIVQVKVADNVNKKVIPPTNNTACLNNSDTVTDKVSLNIATSLINLELRSPTLFFSKK